MSRLFFYFTLIIVIFSNKSLTQERYIIYFKDKGRYEQLYAKKSFFSKSEALKFISESSYKRRLKSLPEDKIIDWRDLPIDEKYLDSLKSYGLKIKYKLKWFNAIGCYLNENQLNSIRLLSFVSHIQKARDIYYNKDFERNNNDNLILKNKKPFDVKNYNINYGNSFLQISFTDVLSLHNIGIDGSGVIVGVLDTGFDWKRHEALKTRKIIAEWDFVNNDSITTNQSEDSPGQHNHGTLCFSVIGGYAEGKLVGVAYNSSFLLAKTENITSETKLEEEAYAAALEWMDSIGVDVTTSSLGYNIFDNPADSYTYANMNGNTAIVTKAVNIAFEKGILTFTSAGNEGNNSWRYIIAPADGFNVIAVGAVNSSLQIASFSSRGPTYDGRIKPDVCALGVNVYGAQAGTISNYTSSSGTSLACPLAAGVGALLLSTYPWLSNVQARDIILKTASNFNSPNNDYGYGIISAKKAIEYPNIKKENDKIILNKSFISDSINSVYVKIYNQNFNFIDSIQLSKYKEYFYNVDITSYSIYSKIFFKFIINYLNDKKEEFPQNSSFYSYKYNQVIVDFKEKNMPSKFELSQNYPNPFNMKTTIDFSVLNSSEIKIIVYDIMGKEVKTIFNDNVSPGNYKTFWDGLNNNGKVCSSGVYFYSLYANGKFLKSKKMILIK